MDIVTAMQGAGLGSWVQWVVLGGAVLSTVASILSAVLPDSKVGSIINVLAANIGKARNDPGAQ